MKPMLADDADESRIQFPCIAQPKVDGVRGLHTEGYLTGRSLKPFGNRYTNGFFGHAHFAGLDGELAAAHECDPELCRKTSSATSTHDGSPWLLWWCFDYLSEKTIGLPYHERYGILKEHVFRLMNSGLDNVGHLRVIEAHVCNNHEELLYWDTKWLDEGYEGTIIRGMNNRHKQGRSTIREGGLLRIKRFIEEDAVVISIVEGDRNDNEAQTNELGHTFRSTHQANMTPNGMVGSFTCRNLKDDKIVTVSPGKMPHPQRRFYFENQHEIVGKVIKYKHFPKGVKDKPRFPTFQCIRSPEDM
jgi:DNA ligase-1